MNFDHANQVTCFPTKFEAINALIQIPRVILHRNMRRLKTDIRAIPFQGKMLLMTKKLRVPFDQEEGVVVSTKNSVQVGTTRTEVKRFAYV